MGGARDEQQSGSIQSIKGGTSLLCCIPQVMSTEKVLEHVTPLRDDYVCSPVIRVERSLRASSPDVNDEKQCGWEAEGPRGGRGRGQRQKDETALCWAGGDGIIPTPS